MSFPKNINFSANLSYDVLEKDMNESDLDILSSSVDEESKKEVMNEFYKRNQVATEKINDIKNIEPKIQNVIKENNEAKMIFSRNFYNVYNDLNNKFIAAHANNEKKFNAIIEDTSTNKKSAINLPDWLKLNPVKAKAIQAFIDKLKKNGWYPELKFIDDVKSSYPSHIYDGEMGAWDSTNRSYYTGDQIKTGGYRVEINCDLK